MVLETAVENSIELLEGQTFLDVIKPARKFPLQALLLKQELSYFGHIMRAEYCLERSIMLGMGD